MCFDADSRPPIAPGPDQAVDVGEVVLTGSDGNRFSAFLARARQPTRAGALVLPDIRGLHRYYEELAVRLAEHGVDALALDYFGRTAGIGRRGDGFEFQPHVERLRYPGLVADIAAAAACLRSEEGGGVGSLFAVGFCLGGRLAFLAPALDLGFAGAVGFYGRPTDEVAHGSPPPITVVDRLAAPVLAIFAGHDVHIATSAARAYQATLEAAGPDHRVLIYPDAPHSFFDMLAAEYAQESESAWAETLGFIRRWTAVA